MGTTIAKCSGIVQSTQIVSLGIYRIKELFQHLMSFDPVYAYTHRQQVITALKRYDIQDGENICKLFQFQKLEA